MLRLVTLATTAGWMLLKGTAGATVPAELQPTSRKAFSHSQGHPSLEQGPACRLHLRSRTSRCVREENLLNLDNLPAIAEQNRGELR